MPRVRVRYEVKSGTHPRFTISCPPYFDIVAEEQAHFIQDEREVGRQVVLEVLRFVDACLAGLSIVGDGVFSRNVWTVNGLYSGITFLGPKPQALPMVGGISVMQMRELDQNIGPACAVTAESIVAAATNDQAAFAVLATYSVSNWFF